MKVNLYAIHDSKACAYANPFPMHTDGLAIRSFMQACLSQETNFSKYPLDFTLFRIGTYDDETSLIKSEAPPEMLLTASQALALAEKEVTRAIQDKKDNLDSEQEIEDYEVSNDSES